MLSIIRLSVLAALREIKNASQIEIIFLKIYSRFFVQGSPETNDIDIQIIIFKGGSS